MNASRNLQGETKTRRMIFANSNLSSSWPSHETREELVAVSRDLRYCRTGETHPSAKVNSESGGEGCLILLAKSIFGRRKNDVLWICNYISLLQCFLLTVQLGFVLTLISVLTPISAILQSLEYRSKRRRPRDSRTPIGV